VYLKDIWPTVARDRGGDAVRARPRDLRTLLRTTSATPIRCGAPSGSATGQVYNWPAST